MVPGSDRRKFVRELVRDSWLVEVLAMRALAVDCGCLRLRRGGKAGFSASGAAENSTAGRRERKKSVDEERPDREKERGTYMAITLAEGRARKGDSGRSLSLSCHCR